MENNNNKSTKFEIKDIFVCRRSTTTFTRSVLLELETGDYLYIAWDKKTDKPRLSIWKKEYYPDPKGEGGECVLSDSPYFEYDRVEFDGKELVIDTGRSPVEGTMSLNTDKAPCSKKSKPIVKKKKSKRTIKPKKDKSPDVTMVKKRGRPKKTGE